MKVKRLSEILGVTADTVRYYTRIGFIHPAKNKSNGYKEYSEKDYTRMRFILSARQLGFSVEDIGQIIEESDKGLSPCPMVRKLIEQRIEDTEQRFAETVALRKRMNAAIKNWENKPDKAPTGNMICHLIENLKQSVI